MASYRFFTLDEDQRPQGEAVEHDLTTDAEAVVMDGAILEGFPEWASVRSGRARG